MRAINAISEMPGVPAVYALYGGRERGLHVAYVGSSRDLRTRITQHLIRRDSSVATGASVVSLNPDLVTEVRWWEHSRFITAGVLEAAELVAFEVLEPMLRSRGGVQNEARLLFEDAVFQSEMRALFGGVPAGRLLMPTLQDALERLETLERQMKTVLEHLGCSETKLAQ